MKDNPESETTEEQNSPKAEEQTESSTSTSSESTLPPGGHYAKKKGKNLVTTIDGFSVYQAKKIARYAFGDYFLAIRINNKTLNFDIYLRKQLNDIPIGDELLKDFSQYWSSRWNIMLLNRDQEGLITA